MLPPSAWECGVTVGQPVLPGPACFFTRAPAQRSRPRRQTFASSFPIPTHVNVTAAGVTSSSKNSQGWPPSDRVSGPHLAQARATPSAKTTKYPLNRVLVTTQCLNKTGEGFTARRSAWSSWPTAKQAGHRLMAENAGSKPAAHPNFPLARNPTCYPLRVDDRAFPPLGSRR